MEKHCENCGKEIPSNSEESICPRCKSKRKNNKTKIIDGLGGVALLILAVGRFFFFKK